MVLKGFPNVVTWGQHYNIGEKPTVILYTNIDHHVGTGHQNKLRLGIHVWSKSSGLRCSNMVYVCMYVCIVITYSRVRINRVRLPILLVVS